MSKPAKQEPQNLEIEAKLLFTGWNDVLKFIAELDKNATEAFGPLLGDSKIIQIAK